MIAIPPQVRPRLFATFLVALALAWIPDAHAQETGTDSEDGPAPKPHYQLAFAKEAIAIDGRVEGAAWDAATLVELDFEIRPGDNATPPVRTEMLMTYDQEHFYVAFRAFDPEPKTIRAHLRDRDRVFGDDIVGITIDTFNDERRAFEFWANPLGVQLDLFYDDVGGNEDSSWDAIWSSAGRITAVGFEVEMAIPYSSLRFPAASGPQTWGFDGIRFYPRDQDYSFRSQRRDRNRSCYVCQFSKMTGFDGASPGRNLEITPTLTGGRSDTRELGASDFDEGDVDSDLGLTVRWGMTPNLTLSATLNPDFSQVEADSAQLDVNNQFALFFPEKRPFFLEGSDFFSTPFNAVHTRVIADPDWGVKLTGKQGKHGLGVFAAEDTQTNLLLPGSQGSDFTTLAESSTSAVLRYRRDVGEQGALGALVTSREAGGYFNRVAGLDGLIRVTKSDEIRFQGLTSETRYPTAIADEFDLPTDLDDDAIRLAYRHSSRNWFGYATYEDIGKEFRADLGFMPQVDRRFAVVGLERIWWGEKENWWSRMELGGDYDVTEDQSGQELERELEFWYNFNGPYQSFANVRYGRRTRFFNGVEFEESFRNLYWEIKPSGTVSFGMFSRLGNNIDFANTRAGDELRLEPWMELNLGKKSKVGISHTFNRLDVDAGRLFEANLSDLRLTYQFNIRTFVRLITQYFDIERDPSLFADPPERRSQDLFNQVLFAYKINPRTLLFAGYSDSYAADDRIELTQRDRTLFLKLGYAWVL